MNESKTAAKLAMLSAVLMAGCTAMASARAVTIDMVTVGNAGNANDPLTGGVYGGVAYDFKIAKYEVTIGQYTEFLNAVARTDTYGLYKPAFMANLAETAGISRTGSSGSYTYSAIAPSGSTPAGANSASNRPIAFVSWFNAARFANWMANGQPTGGQNNATTEDGAYAISGTTTAPAKNAINPNTGSIPLFSIPTENEWYKAAYYSPALNSGTGGYYVYATQSDGTPGNLIGSGSNQANFTLANVYSVTQTGSYSSTQNYLSNTGAFAGSASYYGTFDQNGNVWEWNDLTGAAGTLRGYRGGDWADDEFDLDSSRRAVSAPNKDNGLGDYTGFRLSAPVAVPEPSTYCLALAGLAFGGFSMWRRKRA